MCSQPFPERRRPRMGVAVMGWLLSAGQLRSGEGATMRLASAPGIPVWSFSAASRISANARVWHAVLNGLTQQQAQSTKEDSHEY